MTTSDPQRVELALLRSEERFKDFASLAADIYWETDAELLITFLSDNQESITGISAEHWFAQSYLQHTNFLISDLALREKHQQDLLDHQAFDIEYQFHTSEGRLCVLQAKAKPIFDSQGGFKGYRGIAKDYTEAYCLAKQLEHRAIYDDLTGLVNRREFELRLERIVAESHSNRKEHVFCYLDLDQFKIVNDTVGHLAGDQLLKQVAELLKRDVRSTDTLARLGGDEFGILLENCPLSRAVIIAEKLIADLTKYSFNWHEKFFKVGVSIGLVAITEQTASATHVMSQADIACYAAKDLGRNRFHIYQQEDQESNQRHSDLLQVSQIQQALNEDRFCLYYQFITPLEVELEPYYEILVRLKDETGKLVPPGAFIPAAERYNLMPEIDKWVMRHVLIDAQHIFARLPFGQIAMNLSGTSLNDPQLGNYVKQLLKSSSLPAERICFEITETAVVSNLGEALAFISDMRKLGIRFALDDFGSGLSSFSYLKRFEVDFLKIDGSLVRDMSTDYTDQVMIQAINQIGHAMNIHTIAEFVETEDDIAMLKSFKVDYAQGFAISRPSPIEELEKILNSPAYEKYLALAAHAG